MEILVSRLSLVLSLLAVTSVAAVRLDAQAASLTASPNPIGVAVGVTVGAATISWNAPGHSVIAIHLGSASGALFAMGGSSGWAQTGNWVTSGMQFVLVDNGTNAVLATTTVNLAYPWLAVLPDQLLLTDNTGLAVATLQWGASGHGNDALGVIVGNGTCCFASGGPGAATGLATTGKWVTNGMVFNLWDITTNQKLASAAVAVQAATKGREFIRFNGKLIAVEAF
jgi:hypothetical protein